MWIKADGQLSDSSYLLTTPVSSHLLVFGDVAALIDCGIAGFAQELCSAVSSAIEEEIELKYLCLTHAHFDHVGGIVALRKKFPKAELICSSKTAALLEDSSFVEELFKRNASFLNSESSDFTLASFNKALKVDRVVAEGDALHLGSDVELKVISCPGHTADTTGYYLLPDQALVAAEAVGGFNGRDKLAPCFLDSIESYTATLDRLLALNIKILALPHSGVLTGDLSKRYLLGAREQVKEFSGAVKSKVEDGMIREELYFDLVSEWAADGLSPEGPFVEEQAQCVRRMVDLCLEKN
jgi:glyoxylase-like metal-dependent hydrolase (beta-lactamase superfamily II)